MTNYREFNNTLLHNLFEDIKDNAHNYDNTWAVGKDDLIFTAILSLCSLDPRYNYLVGDNIKYIKEFYDRPKFIFKLYEGSTNIIFTIKPHVCNILVEYNKHKQTWYAYKVSYADYEQFE